MRRRAARERRDRDRVPWSSGLGAEARRAGRRWPSRGSCRPGHGRRSGCRRPCRALAAALGDDLRPASSGPRRAIGGTGEAGVARRCPPAAARWPSWSRPAGACPAARPDRRGRRPPARPSCSRRSFKASGWSARTAASGAGTAWSAAPMRAAPGAPASVSAPACAGSRRRWRTRAPCSPGPWAALAAAAEANPAVSLELGPSGGRAAAGGARRFRDRRGRGARRRCRHLPRSGSARRRARTGRRTARPADLVRRGAASRLPPPRRAAAAPAAHRCRRGGPAASQAAVTAAQAELARPRLHAQRQRGQGSPRRREGQLERARMMPRWSPRAGRAERPATPGGGRYRRGRPPGRARERPRAVFRGSSGRSPPAREAKPRAGDEQSA